MRTFWTDKRRNELLVRWISGQRGSQIAKALGCSRNAVIGKLYREGWLGISEEERSRRQSEANKAFWASKTPVQRRILSAHLHRRAA